MPRFEPKVYIVQRATGEIVGVKLTFSEAHTLAKAEAPAQVLYGTADKTAKANPPVLWTDQSVRNQLHRR